MVRARARGLKDQADHTSSQQCFKHITRCSSKDGIKNRLYLLGQARAKISSLNKTSSTNRYNDPRMWLGGEEMLVCVFMVIQMKGKGH